MGFGVYIHFPYCRSKCLYCDFASVVAAQLPHERYARAIVRELALRLSAAEGRVAGSIYVGGGTPSLWEPGQLGFALAAVRAQVKVAADAEVTVEANPNAADTARFEQLRALGVNRLSMGIQSLAPQVLRALGRTHTAEEALEAVAAARAARFDALALDLIYGSPGQDLAAARADAQRMAELKPEHLSCYALTLEGLAVDVPLAERVRLGEVHVPDEDAQWEMGGAVEQALLAAGYQRYEISNYSQPGREARHNTLYWTGGEYLGLGCGAYGFALTDPSTPARGGRRWSNHRSPELYLEAVESGRLPEEQWEPLDAPTLLRERIVMGLRRVAGVDLAAACRELAQPMEPLAAVARSLAADGLARFEGARLTLTVRGMDLHTECAMRFI